MKIFFFLLFFFLFFGIKQVSAASLLVPKGSDKLLPDADCDGWMCKYDSVIIEGTLKIGGNKTPDGYGNGVTIETPYFEVKAGGIVTGQGRGYPTEQGAGKGGNIANSASGTGGGGHGGRGGAKFTTGGEFYDSAFFPKALGSGAGGMMYDDANKRQGQGGSALWVKAENGIVIIDGSIIMDGNAGVATLSGVGGGAGGSLLIQAKTLSGAGILTANGGNGSATGVAGGGAGGRIAVWYQEGSHDGLNDSTVKGGSSKEQIAYGDGGSLAFFRKNNDRWDQFSYSGWQWNAEDISAGYPASVHDITFLNVADARIEHAVFLPFSGAFVSENSRITFRGPAGARGLKFAGDIVWKKSNASCTQANTPYFFQLLTDQNVSLDADSVIDLSGCGYGPSQGLGAPAFKSQNVPTAGGSFGGVGGGIGTGQGEPTYGSATKPNHWTVFAQEFFGSGGGTRTKLPSVSRGGGAVYLFAKGNADLSGMIKNNGTSTQNSETGGGSGGSVLIEIEGLISGIGAIVADGGAGGKNGSAYGGGGGGGRVAVYYHGGDISGFSDSTVKGGSAGGAAHAGENGTMGFFDTSFSPAKLTSFSGWEWLSSDSTAEDPSQADFDYEDVVLENVELARFESDMELFGNIRSFQMNNSVLYLRGGQGERSIAVLDEFRMTNSKIIGDAAGITLTITGNNFSMDAASEIMLAGSGAGAQSGAGAGASGGARGAGSGAGHGGRGGDSETQPGGITYDSSLFPELFGSGGGNAPDLAGGWGGGAVNMVFEEFMSIYGTINVNGTPGKNGIWGSGGGSGGSVLLKAPRIGVFENALMTANGGNGGGGSIGGGSGGGGRIMLYADVFDFTDQALSPRRVLASSGKGKSVQNDAVFGTAAFMNTAAHPDGQPGKRLAVYTTWGFVDLDAVGGTEYEIDSALFDTGSQVFLEPEGQEKKITVLNRDGKALAFEMKEAEWDIGTPLVLESRGSFDMRSSSMVASQPRIAFALHVPLGEVQIDASSKIMLDGAGHLAGTGPGRGKSLGGTDSGFASGGGYGGRGGEGNINGIVDGGIYYGSAFFPSLLFQKLPVAELIGSGGGRYYATGNGNGGGAISITAPVVTIQGQVSADGLAGIASGGSARAGGGAGGSVFLDGDTVSISGNVTANGGGSELAGSGGGGAGGRVAVRFRNFLGDEKQITAYGAPGYRTGQYGSVGFFEKQDAALLPPSLDVYTSWTFTEVDREVFSLFSMRMHDDAKVRVEDNMLSSFSLSGPWSMDAPTETELWAPLRVKTSDAVDLQGTIRAVKPQTGLYVASNKEVNFSVGGSWDFTGTGYPRAAGPGKGGSTRTTGAGGAGYGGSGGGVSAPLRGASYGMIDQPMTQFGSGGGNFDTNSPGGAGGGAIELLTQGDMSMNATLKVNATSAGPNAGGGSGGTIYLAGKNISGAGFFELYGGSGGTASYLGGGGAGGRLYICYQESISGSLTESSHIGLAGGGPAATAGGIGTKYIEKNCFVSSGSPRSGFVETKRGDTYTRGNVSLGEAPTGRFHGTFIIAADGTLHELTRSEHQDQLFQNIKQNPSEFAPMIFPDPSNTYRVNATSVLDIAGIKANRYGILKSVPWAQVSNPLNRGLYYFSDDLMISGGGSSSFIIKNGNGSRVSGAGLIVIEGGDLHITSNLEYEAASVNRLENLASIGFVVLSDASGKGGNIYIDPAVERVYGAFYAEKSFYTGKSEQKLTVSGVAVARKFEFERVLPAEEPVPNGDGSAQPRNDASEVFLFDGRVLANTPPGLEDLVSGLPKFHE